MISFFGDAYFFEIMAFSPLQPLPLALPAPREVEARALGLRVVEAAARTLGQAAFRLEIGEVAA